MKLKDQCTTLEQSKRLLELGFDEDTASLIWMKTPEHFTGLFEDGGFSLTFSSNIFKKCCEYVPSWTVTDMMQIISDLIGYEVHPCGSIDILYDNNHNRKSFKDNNLLRDNIFEALVWVKENKINIDGRH